MARAPRAGLAAAPRRSAGAVSLSGVAGWLLLVGILASGMANASGFLRLEGHGGPIKGVAVSPAGDRALTASFDYSLGHWDLATGRHIAWGDGHEAAVNEVRFLPNHRALSAGDDFTMILWDLAAPRVLRRFEGHRGKILGLAISPDGRQVATAGWDGAVGLWEIETGRRVRWLEGHDGPVNDVAFAPDGATLYSAAADGTIRAWDPATGREIRRVVGGGFGINRLGVAPDGAWLAYGTLDGVLRVIALPSGAPIADLTADRRPILALALEPDGRRVAVGDGQGHIMVVETAGWQVAQDFRAAEAGPIWALAWDGQGRLLAGGLADEAALWPVNASPGALFTEAERHFQRDPAEMGNGERQFVRKCAICHTLGPDGARRAGPSLHGVFGREAGTLAGYPYSEALKRSDLVWGAETIDRLFAEGPDHVTPGSKMPMQRIAGSQDRQDLIDFLAVNTMPGAGDDAPRAAAEKTGGTK